MGKSTIKIEEALEFHEINRNLKEPKIPKSDLADVFFEGSREKTRSVNMSNLLGGRTVRVDPKWIRHLCKVTGVDANFLFGVKPINEAKLKKYKKERD